MGATGVDRLIGDLTEAIEEKKWCPQGCPTSVTDSMSFAMAGLGVGRFTMSDWGDKRFLFKLCMPGGRISMILAVKSEMSGQR
jgi:hypothetical protein